jgi:formate-dependent nitrite reductase membrane component NrfD
MATGAKEAGVLMAASPIAGIAMSGMTNIPFLDPNLLPVFAIAPAAICTLLFAVLVRKEEQRIGERVRKEHEVRGVETLEPV